MAAPPIPPIGSIIAYAGLMMGPNRYCSLKPSTPQFGRLTTPAGCTAIVGDSRGTAILDLDLAIGTAWGGDATFLHLPDLRGYFLRGVEPARDQQVDQDRDMRTSNPHLNPNVAPKTIGPLVGSSSSWRPHRFRLSRLRRMARRTYIACVSN